MTAQNINTCLIVLTDTLYLPGTIKLIDSFFAHNPRMPVIALSDDPQAIESTELKSLCQRSVLIDSTHYTDIRPYKKRRSKRHARTFYKFEAFADFGYERNLYLDSDILCLRPTPKLFESSESPLLAAIEPEFRPTRGYKGSSQEINSGVLRIHKTIQGQKTVDRLRQIAKDNPGRGGYNSGDQGIINKWIRSDKVELSFLPPEYNLVKKDYSDASGLDGCRLLHYCDRKPWFDGPKTISDSETIVALWHRMQRE